MTPKTGEVYEFIYTLSGSKEPTKIIVTHVTETHVYYKFGDVANKDDSLLYHRSYPMTLDLWLKNPDQRKHVGNTSEPEALEFFT